MYDLPAYDERWRCYSPAIILNSMILQNLFADEPQQVFEPGFGYTPYEETLSNRKEIQGEIYFFGFYEYLVAVELWTEL